MNIASKVKYNKRFKDNKKPTEDAIIAIRPVSIDHFIDKKKVESISRKVRYSYFEQSFYQNTYVLKYTSWYFLNMIFGMKTGVYHSFSFVRLRYHFRHFTNTSNILYNTKSRYSIKDISYKK